ncbi:MAG TPA: hypothetical protein VLC09_11830 [Polyangiaceae bacterium]|nr:hypothetical protein [Polyangiaceae bacterium]
MVRLTAPFGILALTFALAGCDQKQAGSEQAPPAAPAASAAAAPTPQPPAKPTEVTFVKKVPTTGIKATFSRKTSTKFTMGEKAFRESSVMEAAFDVKASDEFRVTKGGLEVKELYTTSQDGTGSEKKSVSPLAGSSYVVTRNDDGKLAALDSGGDKVSASTLKLLSEEYGTFFEKSRDAEFLPDRALKLEEKLMPSSDTMLSALGIKDDGNTLIDGTEFFLKKIEADRSSFDVTMTMTQKIAGAGLRVRAKLKGQIDIRPDGAWIVGIDLKGPLTILDSKGDEKGSGDLSISATQTLK